MSSGERESPQPPGRGTRRHRRCRPRAAILAL